jgi:hypothetical protein
MTGKEGNLYLICDGENQVMSISGIKMFGVECRIPAIFFEEEQALGVLFNLEEANVTDVPQVVRKISGGFTAIQY